VFVRITGDTSKNKNQAYRRKSVVADGDRRNNISASSPQRLSFGGRYGEDNRRATDRGEGVTCVKTDHNETGLGRRVPVFEAHGLRHA